MARFALAFCALGGVLLCSTVNAQCSSGSGRQGISNITAQALASYGMGTSQFASGGRMLASPGSAYDDLLMSQVMAQQVAQQRHAMAMQYQQAREDKLSARRARAEQTRTQTTESRQRTRAALTAQGGSSAAKPQSRGPSLNPTARR